MATGATFPKPTLNFSYTCLSDSNPAIPISCLRFPGSTGVVAGWFGSKRVELTAMGELVKTSAFRSGSTGGESAGMLQEEAAFADGSSRAEFMAQGFETTLNRLSKWIVSAIFCAVILLRHDAEALWAVMGSVVNSILSYTLKRILNHERPISTLRSDPGMPSSHAQSIFFTVGFVILSLVEWLGINVISLMLGVFALAIGSYLTWLRVSQQLHTIGQVAVGAAVGTIFTILWFWSWKAVVFRAFVSFLWVRILVILGAAIFCLGFLIYVIRNWIGDER